MIEPLVRRHQRRGVLVDTNLLLGYLIGKLNPRYLERCRATTNNFHPQDFSLLNQFLGAFDLIVTTPHILTEVSNLAGRLPHGLHREFRVLFRAVISALFEERTTAQTVSASVDFLGFGLTDAVISLLAASDRLVLTDENALYGLLSTRGHPVINFNDVRRMAGFLP